jgi:hypothetical protein
MAGRPSHQDIKPRESGQRPDALLALNVSITRRRLLPRPRRRTYSERRTWCRRRSGTRRSPARTPASIGHRNRPCRGRTRRPRSQPQNRTRRSPRNIADSSSDRRIPRRRRFHRLGSPGRRNPRRTRNSPSMPCRTPRNSEGRSRAASMPPQPASTTKTPASAAQCLMRPRVASTRSVLTPSIRSPAAVQPAVGVHAAVVLQSAMRRFPMLSTSSSAKPSAR